MKKATLKLAALVVFMGGLISSALAQTSKINVVTTAVPFLRISPDARSGGMGDVGIAMSPDANASFLNIARTPFASSKYSGALTYTPWLSDLGLNDVYLITGAGYYQLDDMQSVSFGVRYFNLGNIQFTDALGNNLTTFNPREFSVEGGYSRKLSNRIGLGVALRYINSQLAGGTIDGQTYKTGTAIAGDLHFYQNSGKENGSGFAWGATLSNLGSKISYTADATQKDYIPANLGIGAAYTKVFDADNKITFAADLNKLLVPTPPVQDPNTSDSAFALEIKDYRSTGVVSSWFSSLGDAPGGFSEELKEFQLSLGGEYWYKDQFAFRVGYFYENPDKGNRQFFTIGAGLKYNMFGMNFSYLLPSGSGVNRNPLSNTLRFSLLYDFDKK